MSKPIKNNSKLLYLQARQLFERAQEKFENGTIQSEPRLIEAVFTSFQEFFTSMGKPNMIPRYAPEQGPPWSEDYNNMMHEIMQDLELLFQEIDILGRTLYADFNHNMVQQEIINRQYEAVLDKIRDLETYEGFNKTGVEIGRDDFLNKDKIDYDRIAGTPLEIVDGAVTLPQINRRNVAENAQVTIVTGNRKKDGFIIGTESNGFPGNNTEIHSVTDEVLTNRNYIPTFIGEENSHGAYGAVLDGSPNTWFEYEKVNVREHDRIRVAKNIGWEYQVHENQTVEWAEDPENGVLKLHMQIFLEKEEVINQINCNMYTPPNYGAKTAIVKNILVSDGKSAPRSIMPKNKSDDQYSFHFPPVKAKVISVIFEQPHKYITDIGHIFYEKKMQIEDSAEYAMDAATSRKVYAPRVEGPLVSLEDLGIDVNVSENNVEATYPLVSKDDDRNTSIGETINRLISNLDSEVADMGVEKFEGFRWCIGIRDIEVFSCEYAPEGELVTRPFYFDKPIDKISIEVNETLPSMFTENDSMKYDWLSYYVSIDDGAMWHPISPLRHDVTKPDQPPKIYTVRTIEESAQRLENKEAYLESEYPVYSLRLKIVGRRPEDFTLEAFSMKDSSGDVSSFDDSSFNQSSPIISNYMFHIDSVQDAFDSEESDRIPASEEAIGDRPDTGFDPDAPPEIGGPGGPWDDDDGDGIPNWKDPDHPEYVPDPPEGWEPPGNPGTYPDFPPDGGTGPGGKIPGGRDPDESNPDYEPKGLHLHILNPKREWCIDEDLVIKSHFWDASGSGKATLKINGEVIEERQVIFGRFIGDENNLQFIIPAHTYEPQTITVLVEGEVGGRTIFVTNVINLIDCEDLPPSDRPSEKDRENLNVIIDRKIDELCECEDLVFYGSAQGPRPIQSMVFRINGQAIDPNNLGTPPAQDPCGEILTPPVVNDPDPEPEDPDHVLDSFLSPTSNADTTYWTGKRGMGRSLINGMDFTLTESFWEGRNNWLDLISHISGGNPPFSKAKVNTEKAFYNHLYEFIVKVKEGGVTLPEPFSKFDEWCDENLPSLSKTERGTIYASYKFQKPAIIHQSGTNYLRDGVIDMMARYLNDPKLKSFTYHWIDFADIQTDTSVLAWVLDIPSLPALLSYMNFEETAMNAGIGNMKAIRPIDYRINAGQDPNSGQASLNESVLAQYYQGTEDFSARDDYFTVQSLPVEVLGVYGAIESAVHEAGHAISNYGTEAYPTPTIHKYSSDAGKVLHDYQEWYEISGWDTVSREQDGKAKFTKNTVGFRLANGKEAPVSSYGCTSPAEDFADAFDFYVINPELLRDHYPQKYAFMEKYVKNMPNREITPFSLVDNKEDKIERIEATLRYETESYKEVEEFGDFISWIEEFERREDCGCKSKKAKTFKPMYQLQATPFYSTRAGSEESFYVHVPYWKLRELGAQPGSRVKAEVSVIDVINEEAHDEFEFIIEDCERPSEDEHGNPRVRDCYALESIEVHYYNHSTRQIEVEYIPHHALPYGEIDNGAGSAITVGWNKFNNAPVIMQTSGYDDSGYTFQIHAVGLNYFDEYDQLHKIWTLDIGETTPTVKNTKKMIGDASRNASWIEDMNNGDYSTSPSLGKINDYVTFVMDNDWIQNACELNVPHFYPEDFESPEEPDDEDCEETEDCNTITHVIFEVYDEIDRQLKVYKIDISAEGKDSYQLRTKNGIITIVVGWSAYFNSPTLQIQQAAGDDNILLTAMGAVYINKCGNAETAWGEMVRYRTNGVQYPEFAIGGRKELANIDWISNGVVDYDLATYIGKQGDIVAFSLDEEVVNDLCEVESIDDVIGIDPDNPPDIPKIDFNNLPDVICYEDGDYLITATSTDSMGLKSVYYGMMVNGIDVFGPFEDQVEGLQHVVSFNINPSELQIGDEIRLHVIATNVFGIQAVRTIDLIVETCDAGPPEIEASVDLPTQDGKYCYRDLIDGTKVPIDMHITEDTALFEWKIEHKGSVIAGDTYDREEEFKDTGSMRHLVPIQLPEPIEIEMGQRKADIVFIFDTSGSMSPYINNVKSNLEQFKQDLVNQGIDAYMGYVDSNHNHSDMHQPLIPASQFNLNAVETNGGGWENQEWKQLTDTSQGGMALSSGFRQGAAKFFIVVTDTYVSASLTDDVVQEMNNNNIRVSFVHRNNEPDYQTVANATGGYMYDMESSNFSNEMRELANDIISETSSYYPDGTYTITIEATDHSGKTATKTFTLNFTDCEYDPDAVNEDDISNEYNVLIRSKWGALPKDLDIYVYVDRDPSTRLYYGSGGRDEANQIYARMDLPDGSMYLNFDYTDHDSDSDFNTKYEVVTLDGFANKAITVILDHRDQGVSETRAPRLEIVNKAGAVVHTMDFPAHEWTVGRYMRACEFQLDANGNFSSIIRGKASISGDDPTL